MLTAKCVLRLLRCRRELCTCYLSDKYSSAELYNAVWVYRNLASTEMLTTKAQGQIRHLKSKYNWSGLLMDGGHTNASINLHREIITSANVVELFGKHAVPYEPDYVSIDIDSTDLWILRAVLASAYRPRVLTVEYNCVYGALPIAGTHPDEDMPWKGD